MLQAIQMLLPAVSGNPNAAAAPTKEHNPRISRGKIVDILALSNWKNNNHLLDKQCAPAFFVNTDRLNDNIK